MPSIETRRYVWLNGKEKNSRNKSREFYNLKIELKGKRRKYTRP